VWPLLIVIFQFEHQADIKGDEQQKLLETSLWLIEIKFLKKSVYNWHSLFKNGQE
jgi:hypothetical protein